MNTPKTAAEMTAIILEIFIDGDTPTTEMVELHLSQWEAEIRLDQVKIDKSMTEKVVKETFGNED